MGLSGKGNRYAELRDPALCWEVDGVFSPARCQELIKMAVLDEVKKRFRPEFINRLDEMVIFHRLEREHMNAIVDIQLRHLQSRLARRDLSIVVTAAAKAVLVEAGWDPQYGARPLKRAIQRLLQNPLAQRLLAGDFKSGEVVLADAPDGELLFTKQLPN